MNIDNEKENCIYMIPPEPTDTDVTDKNGATWKRKELTDNNGHAVWMWTQSNCPTCAKPWYPQVTVNGISWAQLLEHFGPVKNY